MAPWQAARYGLGGELVDVAGERSVPASEMVDTLLGLLRPALEEHDECEVVSGLVHQVAQRGTGAARQRRALERAGRLEDVVDLVVGATTSPAGA